MPSLGMTHNQPRQAPELFIATKQCSWGRCAVRGKHLAETDTLQARQGSPPHIACRR